MKRIICVFCTLLFVQFNINGQPTQDLRTDEAFFLEQAQLYQSWLEETGLGDFIHFKELGVREKALAIYLEFKSDDIDWVVNAWGVMKRAFEAKSDLTLEQQLFYKAEALMEVRQSVLSVELYDTYDYRKMPLFQRAIYFDEGQVKSQRSDPKSKIEYVELPVPNMRGSEKVASEEFRQRYNKASFFSCIVDYAKKRFEKAVCSDRYPEVRVLEDNEVLRFRVVDLCKEVLIDESSVVCGWLKSFGYDCNWAKRELLTFTITYEETLDGIRLKVEIDGKIGSGFYANVRRGGYISMESDRDEELTEYATTFANDLRKMLQECQ